VALRIISGGQTGVDRAALDVAIAVGMPHGGWCPLNRIAEDGTISDHYHLQETNDSDYSKRTKLNVRDSDGTLILNAGKLEGGTALTIQIASTLGRPCLILDLDTVPDKLAFHEWLKLHKINTLNVAGPRESKRTGIYEQAKKILLELLIK
jgi:predicted Rossmann fold nucleotide-binding protein DprA/Smf involved in DNA uptake